MQPIEVETPAEDAGESEDSELNYDFTHTEVTTASKAHADKSMRKA